MTAETDTPRTVGPSSRPLPWVVGLLLIVGLGTHLRFAGLGTRSLWYDEFSTWHVSQLGFAESLRWLPEVKMAPLYQVCLRSLTDDPRPAEWVLRLPAATAGVLAILAAFWLGKLGGGWAVGCALAGLLACNSLQLDYSQEARPYTMLVLGGTLSVGLWYRLVVQQRPLHFFTYIVVATLTVHAHYLAVLTILGQACWWAITWLFGPPQRRSLRPLAALIITAVLCTPIVIRYVYFRSPVYQGLEWIPTLTWQHALEVLEQLTFGRAWVLVLVLPALLLWVVAWCGLRPKRLPRPGGELFAGPYDLCGLLVLCFAFTYFGLVTISWIGQPLMVPRYALAAAAPLLLIPLLLAHRLDRRTPLLIMAFFVIGTAPAWLGRGAYPPGFREMAQYLNEHVDPQVDAVAMAIYDTSHPDVVECERLGFAYYPLERAAPYELWLGADPDGTHRAVLGDPRGLYLVVFEGEPVPLLEEAGRRLLPFVINGEAFSRLYFKPYRLIRVAPLSR
jgi:hypothetical protein